jgi:hypothetical protein
MTGETDFSDLWGNKAPEDYGYGHTDINQFYIDKERYGDHAEMLNKVNKIIKTAPAKAEDGRAYFDDSDSQTDYFHCAFYYAIQVGKYDRPYLQKEA